MNKRQILGLKKRLTVCEAADLIASDGKSARAAEGFIEEAIESGELKASVSRWVITDYWNGDYYGKINQYETTFDRSDFDGWLKDRGLSYVAEQEAIPPPVLPEQLAIISSGTTEKTAPVVTPATLKKKDLVAWQDVVLENWSKIAEYQTKPPARRVMKWLRDNGPRDTFPPESRPGRDSLCWTDRYGGAHTLTINRLSTVLSEWRRAGKIPA